MFKPLSLQYFVTEALANQYQRKELWRGLTPRNSLLMGSGSMQTSPEKLHILVWGTGTLRKIVQVVSWWMKESLPWRGTPALAGVLGVTLYQKALTIKGTGNRNVSSKRKGGCSGDGLENASCPPPLFLYPFPHSSYLGWLSK